MEIVEIFNSFQSTLSIDTSDISSKNTNHWKLWDWDLVRGLLDLTDLLEVTFLLD